MSSHLLSLAALHAAAPGVLDVIFGPDGDFEGAPFFVGPVRDVARYGAGGWHWVRSVGGGFLVFIEVAAIQPIDDYALDLRVPSVAARLAGLCSYVQFVDADLSPADLAALTLTLAPQIAALRSHP